MVKNQVLDILSGSSDYVSGEEISGKCGVSRTAVWKNINSLRREGYDIRSEARKGYLLVSRPDRLLQTEIAEGYEGIWNPDFFYTYEEVDSTNTKAREKAEQGAAEGTAVVAEKQNRGKGRLGRDWESPASKGVWMSVILRPGISPREAPQLVFVAAVAVVRAVEKVTGMKADIKWPNDILIGGRKVCGILTELSAQMESVNHVIIGMGMNVNHDSEDFSEEIAQKAVSLKIAGGRSFSRAETARAMLVCLEQTYGEYISEGFTYIMEIWKKRSATLGRSVSVLCGEETIKGKAVDLDKDGLLIVVDEDGREHRILAGDVSLRSADGNYA